MADTISRDRGRWLRLVLWPLGFALAGGLAGAVVLDGISSQGTSANMAFLLVIGLSFHVSGLIAWGQHPQNRTGPLLVAIAFAWLLSLGLFAIDVSAIHTAGRAFGPLYIVICGHLLLAFPTGHLETRTRQAVIALGYLDVVVLNFVWLLFEPRLECDDCPPNAIDVFANAGIAEALKTLEQAAGALLSLIAVGILVIAYRGASEPWRRAYAPVLQDRWARVRSARGTACRRGPGRTRRHTIAVAVVEPLRSRSHCVRRRPSSSPAFPRCRGSARSRARPDAFPRGRAGGARPRARRPQRGIAYWRPDEQRFIDSEGRSVELPRPQSGRIAHSVLRDQNQIGVLLVDDSLGDTELLDAVCAAAALALENQQLQAELRARVEELHTSRARLVEAATRERSTIERNLHDGAQQRLVALSLTLRIAQGQLTSDPPAAAELLDEASEQLAAAIDELRELARGIHPAVLSDRGLEPALEALCGRAPMPVDLSVQLDERLPPAIEVAAYYTVAEALTNVTKYARADVVAVAVSRDNGTARIMVVDDGIGGADPGSGSGILGLVDRVEALDGKLILESPPGLGTTLSAEIPITPSAECPGSRFRQYG